MGFEFQIIDWFSRDETIQSENDEDNSDGDNAQPIWDEDNKFKKNNKPPEECIKNQYTIYMTGKTSEGETVNVKILNFTPFFWIELPSEFKKHQKDTLLEGLRSLLYSNVQGELLVDRCSVRKKFKFRDYQWNKPKRFIQLVFKSQKTLKQLYYKLKDPVTIHGVVKDYNFNVYEKNIDPILRFIHIQEIKPVGWVRLDKYSKQREGYNTYAKHKFQVDWKDVKPSEKTNIGKLRIASFDIEADSSHGDFPIAKKDYYKLGQNICEMIKLLKKRGKTVTPTHISKWITSAFRHYDDRNPKYDSDILDKIKVIYLKNKHELDLRSIYQIEQECYEAIDLNDINKTTSRLVRIFNKNLPSVEGDKVIQIGTVLTDYGTGNVTRHIVTLGTCDKINGTQVVECKTVKQLYVEWIKFIKQQEPSILTGYNIFGFDFKFLWECAEEYNCVSELKSLGPIRNHDSKLLHKELQSSALGQNHLYYLDTPGIILVDLMKVIQREHNLSSYKLDNVAVDFINGIITGILDSGRDDVLRVSTKSTFSLQKGQYIMFQKSSIIGKENIDNKRLVVDFSPNEWIEVEGKHHSFDEEALFAKKSYLWAVGKDDVSPQDIFRLQNESSAGRAKVAKYCVQDCELCIHLMQKLEIIANHVGMGNVCLVPLSYLFMRGQMIKTLSLVSSECRKDGYLIPELPKPPEDVKESYEGAEVLEPVPAIYLNNDPVSVLDYGSLYPSSMIGNNISHDTIIKDDKYLGKEGAKLLKEMNIEFTDVTYDNYLTVQKGKSWIKKVHPTEKTITCRYIQPQVDEDGKIIDKKRGILPRILMKLLAARKATRQMIKTEKDQFRISVLDGLQLAYKITANSLYGGVGAAVSALYYKDIAASTTATGREHLYLAKDYVNKHYPDAEVVYGDTDSIFVNFKCRTENGNMMSPKEALQASIDKSIEVEKGIQPLLKYPHKLEYEKTFTPFILFSKKRYIGNKYEFDINSYKQSSMGVVTKRRDNAPIVKYTYDGIISRIINQQDIPESIVFLKETIKKILNGDFGINYFIITKSLRSEYANPEQIVHKVLADRMAQRDPGNKPQSSDRIPYVYIYNKSFNKTSLQGERVEHPNYILEHNLPIDYLFYITNQIMKPVCQIYGLALNHLEGYSKKDSHWKNLENEYKRKGYTTSEIRERVMRKKAEEAQKLLFEPIVKNVTTKRKASGEGLLKGQKQITSFFTKRGK